MLLERDLCVAGGLRDAVVFAIDAVVVVTGPLIADAIVSLLLLVTRDRCISANDKGMQFRSVTNLKAILRSDTWVVLMLKSGRLQLGKC